MSSASTPAYGSTLYFPAGTTARFRFAARQFATGQPLDLTGGTLALYLKTSETVADASASLTATTANGKLVIMDAALGLFDWMISPADTSPAAYTPGAPWFRYVKFTNADTEVYVLGGSAGPVVLDATTPAVGNAGQLIAYAPTCTAEAIGPESSPVPAYATIEYVDTVTGALANTLGNAIEAESAARQGADETLGEAIAAEALARENADTALVNDISGKQPLSSALSAYDAAPDAAARRALFDAAGIGTLAADIADAKNFVFWGDSLTQGAGGTPMPTQFAAATGYTVFNGGVSSETSPQIKTRFDAAPTRLAHNVVFWVGRNNYDNASQVKSDIAAMVAALGHDRYLVLGIINGSFGGYEIPGGIGYALITQLNADLAATYGARFFDVRSYLVADALAAVAISPTAQDLIDIANDTPPLSLRSDALHLNTSGYQAVSLAIIARLNTIIASDTRALSPSNVLALTSSLPGQTTDFLPAADLARYLGTNILRWLEVNAGSGIFKPGTNNNALIIYTSPSATAGGGIIIYGSVAGEKWRIGLRGLTSGSEGNDLLFGFFNGSTRPEIMRLSGTGGISTPLDVESSDATKGLILKSPNGTRWRVKVDNSGVLSTTSL